LIWGPPQGKNNIDDFAKLPKDSKIMTHEIGPKWLCVGCGDAAVDWFCWGGGGLHWWNGLTFIINSM
jgi:hypothetical protein